MIETPNRGEINTGNEAVRQWANGFIPGAEILEIGFGRGAIPQSLIDAGLRLHLVEASIPRLRKFRQLFPEVPSECSQSKGCTFFGRTFDGVLVCGLAPSVPESREIELLSRIERLLSSGGRLLVVFTPPVSAPAGFKKETLSARANETYKTILWNLGLEVQPDLIDKNGHRHVCAVKHVQAGVPN